MTLVQQLPIAPVHVIKAELDGPAKQDGVSGGGLHRLNDVLPFGLGVSALIDPPRQVSGQPNPSRQHQMAGRPAGIEPTYPTVGKKAEVDHSITRSRSRSSAASSKFSVSTARRSCSRSSAAWGRTRGALPLPSA